MIMCISLSMPTKAGKQKYVGFWMSEEDLKKLDSLVDYFREKEPWSRVNRSYVIRKLINDAYNLIAHGDQSDSKVYKPQAQ